ncbi:hypothetical protein CRG98_012774 [Punica granatum]|uniref:Uncharacterized protein n=1 Tax=Punica granatum TaxID=22663 RepID=A0A2I0KE36_PUNGR|nr:hypothetical protein CRG98_012774 [Punica granatum]
MASQKNEMATSSNMAKPFTHRLGEDRKVFAKNQITFDEFKEAVMLGRLCDSENSHFPHHNGKPNDPREMGLMLMCPTLIKVGIRYPLHADIAELCRRLTVALLRCL